MVRTRSNSKLPEQQEAEKMKEDKEEEEPPKPVSSSSESEEQDDDDNDNAASKVGQRHHSLQQGFSRLFAPYRSLGIVTSGRPFDLVTFGSEQSSQSAMACIPIGNRRFQLLQTNRLDPVLVSQQASCCGGEDDDEIVHVVTDASLRITVTASSSNNLTLFARTRPLQTRSVLNRSMMMMTTKKSKSSLSLWSIQTMLHLGRVPIKISSGEKQGRQENAAVVAVVLAKGKEDDENDDEDDDDDDAVPIVGEDDDDSHDEKSLQEEEDASVEEEVQEDCQGQVVLFLATRTTLQMQRRIQLSTIPTFRPRTALHPATYLNKIVLGGFVVDQNNNGDDNQRQQPAMCLINVRSTKVVHNFQCLPTNETDSMVTALEQSPAVDTIAVGTSRGTVHLVNLRHDKRLFSLTHKRADGEQQAVTITSISFRTDGSAMQYGIAPMAVGRSDGTITVWDLSPPQNAQTGRTILTELKRAHVGGISKLQYLPQEPLLLSTGSKSNAVVMHIFDSPDHSGRILRQRKGHTSPPCKIRYLHPGAGAGGGLLVHDGTDASACQILSTGGLDRTLRVFSTARTVLDKEYSQGQGLEKRARQLGLESTAELLLPPVLDMALSESRSRDWGDLVTIHQNHSIAYVWSTRRGAQSGPLLKQQQWNVSAMKVPPPPQTHATAVAMSACGNFALVGTRGGTIYRYNVESGNPRGTYPRYEESKGERRQRKHRAPGDIQRTIKSLEKDMNMSNRHSNLDKRDLDAEQEAKREQRRKAKLRLASHDGFAVTGLAVDSLNKTVISVGSDKKLILWNFTTHAPHKKSPYLLPSPATKLCHVRESDLAAIALEDVSVVLFDCVSLSIVRRFGAQGSSAHHTGPISDLGFSPDGRNLFTSSLDGTLRVWDVPTNACVDWLSFKAPPTSLTISPTGEFLATTHAGQLGISVWSDRSYYQTVHVDGAPLSQPAQMDEPVPIAEMCGSNQDTRDRSAGIERSKEDKDKSSEKEIDAGPVIPKQKGLVTLSQLPPAHWKNLFHLELVKERNKPKEPPNKPPSAPFFLQWREGEALGDNAEKDIRDTDEDEEWAAAWSDDEDDGDLAEESAAKASELKRDRKSEDKVITTKRRKITHYRSHLALLLRQCSENPTLTDRTRYQQVTDHMATLGPSAIDVALSSLCNGTHDLDEGLQLLQMACSWLIEACQSRERFEVVNAYLNRFLYLHAPVISEINQQKQEKGGDVGEREEEESQREQRRRLTESISQLKQAQQAASEALGNKMQNTLCLLKHFSRMV